MHCSGYRLHLSSGILIICPLEIFTMYEQLQHASARNYLKLQISSSEERRYECLRIYLCGSFLFFPTFLSRKAKPNKNVHIIIVVVAASMTYERLKIVIVVDISKIRIAWTSFYVATPHFTFFTCRYHRCHEVYEIIYFCKRIYTTAFSFLSHIPKKGKSNKNVHIVIVIAIVIVTVAMQLQ